MLHSSRRYAAPEENALPSFTIEDARPDRRWSSALSPLLEDASLEGRLVRLPGF